jgi:transcriptional regulator GlxA family with amidase domain
MDATNVERVAIVLYDGFDELDAIGPYEVFETAADFGADLAADLCTLELGETVTASHGLEVASQGRLDGGYDLVLVPGGGWNDRGEHGARMEVQRGDLPDALVALHGEGTAVGSVCTGGMILASTGLTDGRPATTHHTAVDDLRASGATVVDARVVDDGDLLSAGGVTSGLDLALWIVERSNGVEIAAKTARELEYERTGTVHRP